MLRTEKMQLTRRSTYARAIVLMVTGLFASGAAFPAATVRVESSPLDAAAAAFKPYLLGQVGTCLAATKVLRDRIASRDLVGAQQAWLAARGGWESSEIIAAERFPEIGRAHV